MNTFQAAVYGIIHGFVEFLPVSAEAHDAFVSTILSWPIPEGIFAGSLSLGAFLTLLVYFRHDWASIFSSLLQLIFLRRKPQALDEHLPFFILITTLPTVAVYFTLKEYQAFLQPSTELIILSLVVFSFPLWLAHYFSRQNKKIYDWNIKDSFILGLFQLLLFVPGVGRHAAVFTGALFLNYRKDEAAKFIFFTYAPITFLETYLLLKPINWQSESAAHGLSWMSFSVATATTFFFGLIVLNAFLKGIQKKNFNGFVYYRALIAIGLGVTFWLKTTA